MRRRLFNLATAVSLLTCMWALVLWVRSHRYYHDQVVWCSGTLPSHQLSLQSKPGYLHLWYEWDSGGGCLAPPEGGIYYYFEWKGPPQTGDSYSTASSGPGLFGVSYRSGEMKGYRLRTFACSYWLLLLVFGSLSAARFIRRASPARLRGLCPTCGYDLRATPDRCPECGAVPPATGTRSA